MSPCVLFAWMLEYTIDRDVSKLLYNEYSKVYTSMKAYLKRTIILVTCSD